MSYRACQRRPAASYLSAPSDAEPSDAEPSEAEPSEGLAARGAGGALDLAPSPAANGHWGPSETANAVPRVSDSDTNRGPQLGPLSFRSVPNAVGPGLETTESQQKNPQPMARDKENPTKRSPSLGLEKSQQKSSRGSGQCKMAP
jgi:hypothetical protein